MNIFSIFVVHLCCGSQYLGLGIWRTNSLWGFKGFQKGVIVELASLFALVLGIYGAIHSSGYVADQLAHHIDWDKRYVDLVAFGLTSIGIIFGVSFLGKNVDITCQIGSAKWGQSVVGLVVWRA